MAYKKDLNGNPIISPKQKAVLLYGQRLRGLGSVGELIKHLKELGLTGAALHVQCAVAELKVGAKQEYEQERLSLDPKYESPFNKLLREWEEQDKIM